METSDAAFAADVLAAEGPIVVDFWASWCAPCKMMEPMVRRLADEYADRTPLMGLNIDRNQTTAAQFAISSVPTFIQFAGGIERERKTGALTEKQLRAMLEAESPGRGVVTVVSGLPRSGTSMMMRMLEAGGLPPVTDRVREADADNPHGYYEFEPVKQTSADASWVADACGKAVKMVYRLLYDLPTSYDYRVLFMRRSMEEILASQRAMLARLGETAQAPDAALAAAFERELAQFERWAASQSHCRILEVDYNRLLQDPLAPCRQVNAWLGGALDENAMASVVDVALYRQRVA